MQPGTHRVLNVDDSDSARYVRTRILQGAGMDVREAASGAEALAAISEHPPDLVLLEVKLPDMSGFEVARRLRETSATALLPIIHISAECRDAFARLQGADSGGEVCLVEPVEPEALVSTVRSLLRASEGRRKLAWWNDHGTPLEVRSRGEISALNRCRVLADAVTEEVLKDIASDFLELLDSSAAVFEKNGDCAISLQTSGWCRLLDDASRELCRTSDDREALACGKWLCQEMCRRASNSAIETREAVDTECPGGIRVFAMPIFAGGDLVGSISFGYGDPPTEPGRLAEIAARYGAEIDDLSRVAASHESRPPFIIESAKRRLVTSARLIGALVERKRAETALLASYRAEQDAADRLRRLQAVTAALGEAVTTDQVLDTIITRVMESTGALTGLLSLLNEDGTEFVAARTAGFRPEVVEIISRFPASAPLPICDAARTAEVVLLDSVHDLRYPMMRAVESDMPTRGIAAMPLVLHGRILGGLGLGLPADRTFAPEDKEFFLAVARECAQALERARLYDAEAQARREREHLLGEVTGHNRRLEEMFAAMPAYVAIYSGPDHVLEFGNPENVKLWGGRNPIGKPIREAYPEVGEFYFELWDRVYRSGEPAKVVESRALVDHGRGPEETYLNISLLPRRDAAGTVTGVLAFGVDVTRQVESRRALEDQRAFMETVFNQLPLGVMLVEAPSGKVILFNQYGQDVLRRPAARIGGVPDWGQLAAIHPDGTPYRPEELPHIRALNGEESIEQQDLLYRRTDGSVVTLSVSAAPIRSGAGNVIAAVAAFYDVTERRRERDILERQSQLLNLSRDAVITATPNRIITGWNTGAEETYGWTAAEAIGKPMHELLSTSALVPAPEIDAALVREDRWEGELIHVRKDGIGLILDSRQVLVRDERGVPAGILEINRDVTERKRAEEALRESEQWLKFSQEAAGVGLRDWDLITGVSRCSEQFLRLYGLDTRQRTMTYEQWMSLIHPDDREPTAARVEAALEGRAPYELEFRAVRGDGEVHWIGVKATIFRDEHGKAVRLIGAHFDITDRKRSEEAHHNAQKLESIGLLAGGIAHDFNNLLTGILGNASLVQADVPPAAADRVDAIMIGANKAADLTRQLLAYAGKGRFVVRDTDLATVVREMTDLLRVSIPRHIEVRSSLERVTVRADAGQLQQVIMNLVTNAAEAIGEAHGGTVSISTGVQRLDAPLTGSVGQTLAPGTYAFLEVADNGGGMDQETRTRIFDPFFTTKFLGRGLGLAAVAGIVRSHQGAITMESEPGKGSALRVLFPAVPALLPPVKPAVLVVDDEESVRDFLIRVLEARGYAVDCASNGREALSRLNERERDIGLVLLDVVMPVMGGGETLDRIRSRRPDLKVLLTSGFSEDEVQRLCGARANVWFIQKPYTAQQIAEKVEAVLDD
ncbi:MAG TPA: PAS domain-containing protein [Bryobacteraceae bacterium]|nr:PAS domain-containing protein [Bryobacteraceae bacterium]